MHRLCFGGRVPHRREPDTAMLGDTADHVEDDTHLSRLVEVQPVAGDDVEEVVDRERSEALRLEVVGRHEVLLGAVLRHEEAGSRVVPAARQELEREERMGRTTLAQVELDRVRRPSSVGVTHRDEVDGEASDHAFASEPGTDDRGVGADRRRVVEVGGEAAAEGALSARSAEHLVVRGQQLDLTARCHAQLHARTPHLDPRDELLDDAAALGELAQVGVEWGVRTLELHAPWPRIDATASASASRSCRSS